MAAESEESKDTMEQVFVIGRNGFGQFGLGHTNDIKELTKWTENISIKRINCGGCFTIITDQNDNVWCTGYNANGQLGLGNFDDNIQKFIQNEYFNKNNINIKSIMTNPYCYSSFFLSQTNKLYGCGWNESGQLAINNETKHLTTKKKQLTNATTNDKQNINQPLLMNNISNIKDAQGGEYHTILLDNNGIVYSTKCIGESIYYKCGQNGDVLHNFSNNNYNMHTNGFQPIPFFQKKRIIQISAGCFHSLFLDSQSGVWSCGDNGYGQLGLGHFKDMSKQIPQLIPYFSISKICCGGQHNLCVDDNGNIYAFGNNRYGQCALPNDIHKANKPIAISSLSNDKIIDIKCGSNHSYCKSDNGKHWLFGYNEYNECNLCEKNGNVNKIYEPFCINETMSEITNGEQIKDVYVGYDNTWIITGKNKDILESKELEIELEFIDAEFKQCNYVLSSLDVQNGYVKCFDDSYNELQFKIDKNDNDLIKQIIDTQNKGMEIKQDVFVTINEIFHSINSNKTKIQTVIRAFIKNDNDIKETDNNETVIKNDNDIKQKIKKLENIMTEKDNKIATLKKRLSVVSISKDEKTQKRKYTIEEWLRDVVKLPQYIETFVEHGFDMEILMDVTINELKEEIKIKKLGHRKKIMKAIKNMSNTTK